jgi:thiamine biosynthesis lipoprotein
VNHPAAARWTALGTTVSVSVTRAADLPAARRAVESELAAIDLACSRFRDDSDLMRLNEQAGEWASVGPRLGEAIAVALRAAALTDGAVDPTIGSALVLAGYDRDFGAGLDAPAGPIRAHRVAGWRAVRVDPLLERVRLPHGTRLDLGATAKALAADRAAEAAARGGAVGVLVNLGGDIAVAGPAPQAGWSVAIADDHRASADEAAQVVTIRSGGLASSSTAVRRWGTDRHHIIDPATGMPAVSPWRTVSVAAASCVDANIASTAAIVRGEDAPAWLQERGLPARLARADGEVVTVGRWPSEVVA